MSKKFHSKETKPVFLLGAIGSEFQSLAPVLCKAARLPCGWSFGLRCVR